MLVQNSPGNDQDGSVMENMIPVFLFLCSFKGFDWEVWGPAG